MIEYSYMKQNGKIIKLISRGVEEVIVKEHIANALNSGKKLRVKLGIDPTAPDIHLGHSVVLRKLREFQDLGHKIVLIIGDFTARIGDPSGKNEMRKPLTESEIKKNMKGYLTQASKIIDIKKTEIHYNSEWHENGGLEHMLSIAQSATVQQILKRDDFKKRIAMDSEISVLEMLYPILQGYDSVAIKADVEIGGTDQKFNLLMGRKVQRHFDMPEQDIVTLPLLEGTDGIKKMSKSLENYISLTENPKDMFGEVMAIPDTLIKKYFELLTDIDPPKNLGPYESKMILAETIVGIYHSPVVAKQEREKFVKIFSKKETPENLPELQIVSHQLPITDLLVKAGISSKNEARRLITQNAVEINGTTRNNPNKIISLNGGDVIKIGKKKFFRISIL